MTTYKLENREDVVYETIPEGTELLCNVVKVEERDSFFWVDKDDHSKGKQREIAYRFQAVSPEEYAGRTVFGTTPVWFNNGANCKFRIWTEQILGVDELPEEFELELEDLEDNLVVAIMGVYHKKDGTTGNQVDDLKMASEFDDEPF